MLDRAKRPTRSKSDMWWSDYASYSAKRRAQEGHDIISRGRRLFCVLNAYQVVRSVCDGPFADGAKMLRRQVGDRHGVWTAARWDEILTTRTWTDRTIVTSDVRDRGVAFA